MPAEDGTTPPARSGYPVGTEYPVRDEGRVASASTEGGADAGADAPFWKRRRSFAELPGQELGRLVVPRREPLSHQVNVKLRVEDWHVLCAEAAEFGIRPTTLARLIVERGVEAIASREPEA